MESEVILLDWKNKSKKFCYLISFLLVINIIPLTPAIFFYPNTTEMVTEIDILIALELKIFETLDTAITALGNSVYCR